ncbi:basic proline-rich protein-like, partial [Polypterus senegalus]|uniref:basic proline-rich protein-like n=1 Tax=Polypterus senegalus TaxID=55291 RepID=UPI001962D9E4
RPPRRRAPVAASRPAARPPAPPAPPGPRPPGAAPPRPPAAAAPPPAPWARHSPGPPARPACRSPARARRVQPPASAARCPRQPRRRAAAPPARRQPQRPPPPVIDFAAKNASRPPRESPRPPSAQPAAAAAFQEVPHGAPPMPARRPPAYGPPRRRPPARQAQTTRRIPRRHRRGRPARQRHRRTLMRPAPRAPGVKERWQRRTVSNHARTVRRNHPVRSGDQSLPAARRCRAGARRAARCPPPPAARAPEPPGSPAQPPPDGPRAARRPAQSARCARASPLVSLFSGARRRASPQATAPPTARRRQPSAPLPPARLRRAEACQARRHVTQPSAAAPTASPGLVRSTSHQSRRLPPRLHGTSPPARPPSRHHPSGQRPASRPAAAAVVCSPCRAARGWRRPQRPVPERRRQNRERSAGPLSLRAVVMRPGWSVSGPPNHGLARSTHLAAASVVPPPTRRTPARPARRVSLVAGTAFRRPHVPPRPTDATSAPDAPHRGTPACCRSPPATAPEPRRTARPPNQASQRLRKPPACAPTRHAINARHTAAAASSPAVFPPPPSTPIVRSPAQPAAARHAGSGVPCLPSAPARWRLTASVPGYFSAGRRDYPSLRQRRPAFVPKAKSAA